MFLQIVKNKIACLTGNGLPVNNKQLIILLGIKMIKKFSIKKAIIISIIFMIVSIIFILTIQNLFENKKIENVIAITLNTAESGKLILAETTNSWTGIYKVNSKFLFFEDNWIAKYFIGYKILWYVDLFDKDALNIEYDKNEMLTVTINNFIATIPQIIPETFLILGEKRSLTLNEEKMRVILFNNLTNELSNVYKNLINIEEAKIIAEDSLTQIIRNACMKSKLKYEKIVIIFKE